MTGRRWNTSGVTNTYSPLHNLSRTTFKSLQFHLPDRADSQVRHPDLAESAMCHCKDRLTSSSYHLTKIESSNMFMLNRAQKLFYKVCFKSWSLFQMNPPPTGPLTRLSKFETRELRRHCMSTGYDWWRAKCDSRWCGAARRASTYMPRPLYHY